MMVKPKASTISLKLRAIHGPMVGTEPIIKKFPETTTIQLFKNVMSKLFKIPIAELKISHRPPSNEVNFNFSKNL